MHKTALKKILLFPFVLLVWFPLWFLLMGTLTGSEELAATIGPALSGSGQAAWTLLPSYPTLEPAVKLLLDTPEYFTTYWNTCLQTFPQLAGQLVVGAPAAWALSRLKFRGRGRAGAVPYFNVAAVPGHYGACLSDDKPPGTDGYCLGGHSAGGIQHISRICDAARV